MSGRFALVAGGSLPAPNLTVVEVWDRQESGYLGSMAMTGAQRSALGAELAAVAAVRELHRPCHDPYLSGSPDELCSAETPCGTHRDRRRNSREWRYPLCRECGKPYPCRTVEVLPS